VKERLCDQLAEVLLPWMGGNANTRKHNSHLAANEVLAALPSLTSPFTEDERADLDALALEIENTEAPPYYLGRPEIIALLRRARDFRASEPEPCPDCGNTFACSGPCLERG